MKIKQLLKSKKNWTQGCYAKDKYGRKVFVLSRDATCFCTIGAIQKCYGDDTRFRKISNKVLVYLADKFGLVSIAQWNDSPNRTFKDIKKMVETLDI